jgi:nitrate/TMAO reductase-like tetraheme cytochrome c subunit
MRTLLGITLVVLLIAVVGFAGDYAYTGLSKCKLCHKGTRNGEIYEKWEAGPHAKAFATLGSEASATVYTELGKSGNPQEDPDCLRCHVTGYGLADSLTAKLDPSDGVTCEACHGAGSGYYKKSVMEDREAAIASGMDPDPKAGCIRCHNEESPTYKSFDVEERWPEIAHDVPKEE